VGHVATGTVYVVVGVVALIACFDIRMSPAASDVALHRVFRGELGSLALLVIAFGLAADLIWQSVRAIGNVRQAGPGVAGLANRIAWFVSGLIHFGLAVTAVKMAFRIRQKSADVAIREWASTALSLPFGRFVLAAAGIIVVIVGLVLAYRAWIADVDRQLDLRDIRPALRRVVLAVGRFGLVARGAVLILAGAFVIVAARRFDAGEVQGLGGTLGAIHYRFGSAALGAIAVGFICNGLVEMVRARYRRIAVR
jgi:hypothetical protein